MSLCLHASCEAYFFFLFSTHSRCEIKRADGKQSSIYVGTLRYVYSDRSDEGNCVSVVKDLTKETREGIGTAVTFLH